MFSRTLAVGTFLLAGSMAAVACSSGVSTSPAGTAPAPATDAGDAATPCTTLPDAPVCAAPVDVATADAVYAKILALPEATQRIVKPEFGSALKPSDELHVTAAVELDVAALRGLKPLCPDADAGATNGHCEDTTFAAEQPSLSSQSALIGNPLATTYPTGVTCTAFSPTKACTHLSIAAGTTLRFQRVVDYSGFTNLSLHYVRVVRSCSTPCAANEARCASSTTCLTAGTDSCLLCDGEPAATCACRDRCGVIADGTKCGYADSDDTTTGGKCSAGSCK